MSLKETFVGVATPPTEPPAAAKAVGLRYIMDDTPGYKRQRNGKAFRYLDADGRVIRDPATLGRIKSLVIPPAWKDVWICPHENGHLQATGRDARGRKQHRYHKRWREVRDETKFNRMVLFAKCLPKIRKKVSQDLKQQGLTREKVLAAVVKLLELSLIRVGNEEYARDNNSYGLTTMKDKHVEIKGNNVRFEFRGKSGKEHAIDVLDARLARIVDQCQDLPGQELFQYLDEDGTRRDVKSEDVNEYLRQVTGEDFTAKDFRTWAGTVLAAMALQEMQKFDSQAQAKKNLVRAIESVAERLGNTPSVCKKCYVHPVVINSYLEGSMLSSLKQRAEATMRQKLHTLRAEEAAVLAFLRTRLAEEAKGQDLNKLLKASVKAAKSRRK